MKKILLALSTVVISFGAATAQSGKNQISIGFDVALPMGDLGDYSKTGFGGTAKYLHGVGEAGQVSLTTGYTTFSGKDGADVTTSMIPVLIGYRQNFSGLYIEPQIGFSTLRVAISGFGSASTTGFAYAAAVGYAMEKGLDLSARYQAVSKDGTAGYLGLRIAYNFSLGGSSN